MTPAEIVAAYEKLLETATGIVETSKRSGFTDASEVRMRESRNEEVRTLKWYDNDTVYWSVWRMFENSPAENTTYVMPDYLLMMTPEELEQWREQERSAARARFVKMQEDRSDRLALETERAERELLATLKQKYEGNP